MSLETKAKITHTLLLPTTMYRYENWAEKKGDRKKVDSYETWYLRKALWIYQTNRKMNK